MSRAIDAAVGVRRQYQGAALAWPDSCPGFRQRVVGRETVKPCKNRLFSESCIEW